MTEQQLNTFRSKRREIDHMRHRLDSFVYGGMPSGTQLTGVGVQHGSRVEQDKLLVVHPASIAVVAALDKAPLLLSLDDFNNIRGQQLVHHLGAVGGFSPHRDSRKKAKTLHNCPLSMEMTMRSMRLSLGSFFGSNVVFRL